MEAIEVITSGLSSSEISPENEISKMGGEFGDMRLLKTKSDMELIIH